MIYLTIDMVILSSILNLLHYYKQINCKYTVLMKQELFIHLSVSLCFVTCNIRQKLNENKLKKKKRMQLKERKDQCGNPRVIHEPKSSLFGSSRNFRGTSFRAYFEQESEMSAIKKIAYVHSDEFIHYCNQLPKVKQRVSDNRFIAHILGFVNQAYHII